MADGSHPPHFGRRPARGPSVLGSDAEGKGRQLDMDSTAGTTLCSHPPDPLRPLAGAARVTAFAARQPPRRTRPLGTARCTCWLTRRPDPAVACARRPRTADARVDQCCAGHDRSVWQRPGNGGRPLTLPGIVGRGVAQPPPTCASVYHQPPSSKIITDNDAQPEGSNVYDALVSGSAEKVIGILSMYIQASGELDDSLMMC